MRQFLSFQLLFLPRFLTAQFFNVHDVRVLLGWPSPQFVHVTGEPSANTNTDSTAMSFTPNHMLKITFSQWNQVSVPNKLDENESLWTMVTKTQYLSILRKLFSYSRLEIVKKMKMTHNLEMDL